ncbi:MAG TPA: O-antigen ligase family protein [Methylomirabilota bacterium]|nr:O-antigen ligase family protein [Methylomirabilota bacterium]
MNREALDKFFERGILALVLAILVFAPLAFGAVDAWAFLVVQGLTVCVMLFWALRLWNSPKPQLFWPPTCWAVLAFTLYAVARYFTADIEYVARQELIQILVCAFLFFAIVNNLYRQEFSQAISFTLIFLGMVISACAVFQFFTHSNRVWNLISPYGGRASGTYISPNNLAGFLEMLLPLATAYVLAGRMKPVARILIAYAALVVMAGMAVTFSRGGWAAAAIGLFAVLGIMLGRRSQRIPALALLIVLLAGGGFVAKNYLSKTVAYMDRVKDVADNGQVDLDMRRDMWRAAEEMWRGHFWFGVGPAHYNYRFREYRPPRVQLQPDRAHNDYLNLLADWGTTGGIIVLAGMTFFAAGLLQTRKHVQRTEKNLGGSGLSNRFAFFTGASAGLLALAAHSFVDFNLHIPANAILGVTLLALLTGNLRFATERHWLNLRTPIKILTTAALACGIFYLSRQESRCAAETYWLQHAQSPELSLLERAAILEKAFAAEPKNFETAYDIGEAYRMQSFEGVPEYQQQAETALRWFARAKALNRFDGYSDLRTGMCLDWLDRHAESEKFYSDAEALDPNGYFTVANIGWHYVQVRDYAAAREWLERSLQLEWDENIIGRSYLDLVRQKLIENASGKNPLPPGF